MKNSLLALFVFLTAAVQAQQVEGMDKTPYKIVMQLTSSDTMVQKSLIKQLNNALNAAPKSRIEVVCHNNGISFLQSAKTQQAAEITRLKSRGVVFVACENTMRERKIKREELLPEAETVPAGIIEIVKKQRKKWAYLKAG